MIVVLWLLGFFAENAAVSETWFVQLNRAENLRIHNRFVEADTAYTAALEEASTYGAEGIRVAITLSRIGQYRLQAGRLLDATRCYTRALDIFEHRLPPGNSRTIQAAIDLSGAYLESNEISKAEQLLRRFLQRDVPLKPQDTASLLDDLGTVLVQQGKQREAAKNFQEAIAIFEKDDSVDIRCHLVASLSNLAGVYMQDGRSREALRYAKRALDIIDSVPRANPVLLIKTIANAASAAAVAGKKQEAEQLYQQAIAECEKVFGPDYFLLGRILNVYSQFLTLEHRKDEAKRALVRSKAILERFERDNGVGHTVDAKVLMRDNTKTEISVEVPPAGASIAIPLER